MRDTEVSRRTLGQCYHSCLYLALFIFSISRWLQIPFVKKNDLDLPLLHFHLLGIGIASLCHNNPVYTMPKFRRRASCVQDPSLRPVFSAPRRVPGRVGGSRELRRSYSMFSECVLIAVSCGWSKTVIESMKPLWVSREYPAQQTMTLSGQRFLLDALYSLGTVSSCPHAEGFGGIALVVPSELWVCAPSKRFVPLRVRTAAPHYTLNSCVTFVEVRPCSSSKPHVPRNDSDSKYIYTHLEHTARLYSDGI